MNGLDSPLELLAFIPVNLGPLFSAAANNLWTWLAVITAAFSFWRLRISAAKPPSSSHISFSPPPPPPPQNPTPKTTSFNKDTTFEEEKGEEEGVLTRGNSKKFFTVYYKEIENDDQVKEQDQNDHDDDDDDEDDEMVGGGDDDGVKNNDESVVIKRWGSSGYTLERRGGDLGWYCYQQRNVIDGSVVRLWGEENESSSPRSYRRCSSFGGKVLVG